MTEWMDEQRWPGPSVEPPSRFLANSRRRIMSDAVRPRPQPGELYRDSLGNPVGIVIETTGDSVTVQVTGGDYGD